MRVTRNCPWNRCAFCPVYKGQEFSLRSAGEVKADIRAMGALAEQIRARSRDLGHDGDIPWQVRQLLMRQGADARGAMQIASFLARGGKHAFLQDANSLVARTDDLVEILLCLRETFPTITRVTTYARAHTLLRKKPDDLRRLREAGLNRVHVGLESGNDEVLAIVQKGVTGEQHVEAGLRVKQAQMELSEYVMPGLGGRELRIQHAHDTARVLSAIDPHFVRLRTSAVVPGTELASLVEKGTITPASDEEVVDELRMMLERLEGTGVVTSDHALNLLVEIDGTLPDDKARMLGVIARFQGMDPSERRAFVVGRRAGVVGHLTDMSLPEPRERAFALLQRVEEHYGGDLEGAVQDLMQRYL